MIGSDSVQRCDFRMHDMIDGKFRVERVLNSTRTDQKFKVNDTSGNKYILKLLKLWEVDSKLRQKMLLSADNEIKGCQIKSNYLTNIVHTGVVNGNPYLLMEYLKSVDLSHIVRSQRLDIVRTAKEILYGLRDLHKSGKVHCQLTPENILITDDNHAKLTNYVILGGRANLLVGKNKTLRSQSIVKSLAYQAPELYRLGQCSTVLPSVDIFSFGVVLFQLLTGELPFGRLATESDWMGILDICLSSEVAGRAKDVDEIINRLPDDGCEYVGVAGSRAEVPQSIQHGVMLHVMQGDELDKYYRLPEIMQLPQRVITVGRTAASVFNMIQLSERSSSYISRHHCTIEFDDENEIWYIRDGQWDKDNNEGWACSLNGTFVNSEKVTKKGHKIGPGDIISIGDVKLRVEAY